jgi:hypothetical protein
MVAISIVDGRIKLYNTFRKVLWEYFLKNISITTCVGMLLKEPLSKKNSYFHQESECKKVKLPVNIQPRNIEAKSAMPT